MIPYVVVGSLLAVGVLVVLWRRPRGRTRLDVDAVTPAVLNRIRIDYPTDPTR